MTNESINFNSNMSFVHVTLGNYKIGQAKLFMRAHICCKAFLREMLYIPVVQLNWLFPTLCICEKKIVY